MLNIPSKTEKQASQLRDGIRILAWEQYKLDNPEAKGLDGYQEFKAEWEAHEIQQMDMKQLQAFIKKLGYTDSELLQVRSEYYRKRNKSTGIGNEAANPDDIPY
jgi:hypothetical protein